MKTVWYIEIFNKERGNWEEYSEYLDYYTALLKATTLAEYSPVPIQILDSEKKVVKEFS